MHIISTFLFALSSSCDSIIVGLSYGAKNVRINFLNNTIIAVISGFGTLLSMSCGSLFLQILPQSITDILGSIILIFLGSFLLARHMRRKIRVNSKDVGSHLSELDRYENTLRTPEIIDRNLSKTIESKETILLGVILCLNNIGLGIGASMTGLNIFLTSFLSFMFCLLLIPLGFKIGTHIFSDRLSGFSEVFSIIIIIILGIYELFV